MKKTLLLGFLFATFGAIAQWKTIYEGGFGTSASLYAEWQWLFTFNEHEHTTVNFHATDYHENRMLLSANMIPFTPQKMSAGIYKYLPEMGQYASLRIYLDLDLPDSVGIVRYAKFSDTTFFHGTNTWPYFASNDHSSWVYFSNFEGDNTILVNSVFDVTPAAVIYNYLRVDADTTTQVLNIPTAAQADFKVFSSGKELHIQPSQAEADYEVQLVDLSGKYIYQERKKGQQHIPLDCSTGVYIVRVTQDGNSYQEKVYVE